jgi:hypothetical protein
MGQYTVVWILNDSHFILKQVILSYNIYKGITIFSEIVRFLNGKNKMAAKPSCHYFTGPEMKWSFGFKPL